MIPDIKQQTAINKLSQLKVGALFMDAGAGKTLPTYHLAKSVKNCDYLLYLAPYQTIHNQITDENIITEIEKYGGFPMPHDFVGIESLSNSGRIYLELYEKLLSKKNPVIICDESLKIKNFQAKRTKRILELGKLSTYKLILNGTPISRNLLDLWPQMEFLSPKILNMGQAEFKNTFCEYTKMTKRIGNKTIRREWINKYHNVDYLYSLISPYVFEADYDIDVKLQYIDVDYRLSDDDIATYQRLKETYLDDEKLQVLNNNIFLELTTKMRHGYSCTADKFEVLDKIVKTNQSNKILVVRNFIDAGEALQERYGDAVKVLSMSKHAFGLNLQAYDTMVLWDKTWDYAQLYQVIKRIYRRGQDKDCRIFQLNGNVPLDKMMNDNIDRKGRLLEYFKKKSVKELKQIL